MALKMPCTSARAACPACVADLLKHSVPQVNILDAVRWLVRETQPQDSLVFAFSGHGCLDVSDEQKRDGILSSDYEQV